MKHSDQVAASQTQVKRVCVMCGSICDADYIAPNDLRVQLAPLRQTDHRLLSFLSKYITEAGETPPMKVMQRACLNRSRFQITRALEKLRRHGLIDMQGQSIKTIRLVPRAMTVVGKPNGEIDNV